MFRERREPSTATMAPRHIYPQSADSETFSRLETLPSACRRSNALPGSDPAKLRDCQCERPQAGFCSELNLFRCGPVLPPSSPGVRKTRKTRTDRVKRHGRSIGNTATISLSLPRPPNAATKFCPRFGPFFRVFGGDLGSRPAACGESGMRPDRGAERFRKLNRKRRAGAVFGSNARD
jgi:hypothetical protein